MPSAVLIDLGMPRMNGYELAAQLVQRRFVAAAHRQRANHAVLRQVLHQPEEPRQVPRIDALFIQRQDEIAGAGAQRKI